MGKCIAPCLQTECLGTLCQVSILTWTSHWSASCSIDFRTIPLDVLSPLSSSALSIAHTVLFAAFSQPEDLNTALITVPACLQCTLKTDDLVFVCVQFEYELTEEPIKCTCGATNCRGRLN